jgi:hypothetical protein
VLPAAPTAGWSKLNLLVVLCADQPASPVVDAGTLYS